MVAGDPRPMSQVAAVAFSQGESSSYHRTTGSSRVLETVQGCPRMSSHAVRERAQSSVARLEQALEAMGDGARPCCGGLEGRVDESQSSLEATCCGRGNRPVSQDHRQVGEADRELQCQRLQMRLKRLLEAQSRGSTIQRQDPGSQVTSLQERTLHKHIANGEFRNVCS